MTKIESIQLDIAKKIYGHYQRHCIPASRLLATTLAEIREQFRVKFLTFVLHKRHNIWSLWGLSLGLCSLNQDLGWAEKKNMAQTRYVGELNFDKQCWINVLTMS